MAALTANKTGLRMEYPRDDKGTMSRLVSATARTIYEDAAVCESFYTGRLGPIGAGTEFDAFCVYMGMSAQERVYAASSGRRHSVNTAGGVLRDLAVTGAASADDEGKPVYLSTDNYSDATLTWSFGALKIGYVEEYVSSGVAHVRTLTPDEARAEVVQPDGTLWVKLLEVTLSAESTGDVTGGTDLITFAGAGSITEFEWRTTTPTTDSDADATFNLEINTTNLTGGVVTLGDTSDSKALNGAGLAASRGAIVKASNITAANTFTAGQTLSVECAVSNAYSDGAGELWARFTR